MLAVVNQEGFCRLKIRRNTETGCVRQSKSPIHKRREWLRQDSLKGVLHGIMLKETTAPHGRQYMSRSLQTDP